MYVVSTLDRERGLLFCCQRGAGLIPLTLTTFTEKGEQVTRAQALLKADERIVSSHTYRRPRSGRSTCNCIVCWAPTLPGALAQKFQCYVRPRHLCAFPLPATGIFWRLCCGLLSPQHSAQGRAHLGRPVGPCHNNVFKHMKKIGRITKESNLIEIHL